MYPHRDYMSRNVSLVQHARDFDRDQFPMFEDAEYIDCEIGPGDTLYIPPRWWHHIEAVRGSEPEGSYNISVNYWWNKE